MDCDQTDELRMLNFDMLRCHSNDDPTRPKAPAQNRWKVHDIDNATFEDAKINPLYTLGLKLGGANNIIDIEYDGGDMEAGEAQWDLMTAGHKLPSTKSWSSARGKHRLFSITDAQRKIIGEDVVKDGDMEFRLGKASEFAYYSIIPTPNDCTRQWLKHSPIQPLPSWLCQVIADLQNKKNAPKPLKGRKHSDHEDHEINLDLPGSIYERDTCWYELLSKYGWTQIPSTDDGVEWFQRPGKDTQGLSATLGYCNGESSEPRFYSFSEECAPLIPHKAYNKYAFYTAYEHGEGNFQAAFAALNKIQNPNGKQQLWVDPFEEFDNIEEELEEEHTVDNCYQVPTKLLKIPGLVSWVSDYHAQRHVNSDERLAAIGAYSLLALAGSRRVELDDHTRPNLFTMILGPSTCGKSSMISTLTSLAEEAGFRDELYGDFKSSESMQDAVVRSPVILSTIDECQHRLKMLSDEKDKAAGSYSCELKKLATAAKGTWQRRSGLGKEGKGETIHQPHLSGLWCGITDNAWPAITDDMLGDGFIGRFMIVEVTVGDLNLNMHENVDLRNKIVNHLKELKATQVDQKAPPKIDGCDESEPFIPVPNTVRHTPEAAELSHKMKVEWHAKMKVATEKNEKAASAYGRMHEFMCRLELLISLSAHTDLRPITLEQTMWAIALTKALTRFKSERMHNKPRADSQYEKDCEWVKNKLMTCRDRTYPWAKLSRESPYNILLFDRLIHSMEEQGRLFTDRVFDNYGKSIRHNGSYICLPRHRNGATKHFRKKEK